MRAYIRSGPLGALAWSCLGLCLIVAPTWAEVQTPPASPPQDRPAPGANVPPAATAPTPPAASGEPSSAPVAAGAPALAQDAIDAQRAPEVMLTRWVQALRHNDGLGLYEALPLALRVRLAGQWQALSQRPDPALDTKLNLGLVMLQMPAASQIIMSQIEPTLASYNPKDLVATLHQAAEYLAMMSANAPKDGLLDYAALQGFVEDVALWAAHANLTDIDKARTAVGHVVAAVRGIGATNAAGLRALHMEDLSIRCGNMLKELKTIARIYDLDADALLDSVSIIPVSGQGDHRTLAIAFTAFAHHHTITVKMEKHQDSWGLASGKDDPLIPLSQLFMTLGVMVTLAPPDADAPAKDPAHVPTPSTPAL